MISGAHWHLILNHIPVVMLGLSLLMLAVALVTKHRTLQQVSVSLIVFSALMTLPVYLSGEPAEEQIEHLAGVSEALIKQHEEAAEVALIATGIMGVIGLVAMVGFRRAATLPTWAMVVLLLMTLSVGGTMAWTATLGGQIRHPEIRATSTADAASEPRPLDRQERYRSSRDHEDKDSC
jgi:uncharacterized membrane protein